jgi:hypothetical protein
MGICLEEKTRILALTMTVPMRIMHFRVGKFLAKKSITKVDHPTYSPALYACKFWLFSELKNALKGQRFADIPDIQHMTMLLQGIPENNFEDCLRQWYHHLTKCIASQESISKVTATSVA